MTGPVTEVADLYCAYAWAVDDQDFGALRVLLVDEVRLTFGNRTCEGATALIDTYRKLLARPRASVRHQVTNVRAEVAPDGTILSGAYFCAVFYEEAGPRRQTGRYRDEIVRTPAGLRIAHKRIELDPVRLPEWPGATP